MKRLPSGWVNSGGWDSGPSEHPFRGQLAAKRGLILRFPFKHGRHLASWLGLTPREHSSGNVRRLGGISKRGDRYVRMLLTHGARAVLLRAGQLQRAGQDLNALQRWALALKERAGHNKATCALANKLARIAWATWQHGTVFDPDQAAAHAA